jgi:hypothetical protein
MARGTARVSCRKIAGRSETPGQAPRTERREPDDDLLALTPLQREFDLVCTAQRAKGYKPDGALFRYLIEHAGCAKEEILHVGHSRSLRIWLAESRSD